MPACGGTASMMHTASSGLQQPAGAVGNSSSSQAVLLSFAGTMHHSSHMSSNMSSVLHMSSMLQHSHDSVLQHACDGSAPQRSVARDTSLRKRVPYSPLLWAALWCATTVGYLIGFNTAVTLLLGLSDAYATLYRPHFAPASYHGVSLGVLLSCAYQASKVLSLLAAALLARSAGRKACIGLGAALFAAGVLLGATSAVRPQLLAAYGLTGAGAGCLHVGVFLQDVEVSPPRVRGAVSALFMLGLASGHACGALVMGAAPVREWPWGWRVAWAMALLPAAAVLASLRWLPESPVSLLQRGQLARAREELSALRGRFYPSVLLDGELAGMVAAAGLASASGSGDDGACGRQRQGGWARKRLLRPLRRALAATLHELRLLFGPRHLPMLLVTAVYIALFDAAIKNLRLWTAVLWPLVPPQASLLAQHAAFLHRIALALACQVLGVLAGLVLLDSAGRRWTTTAGAVAAGAALLAIGGTLRFEAPHAVRLVATSAGFTRMHAVQLALYCVWMAATAILMSNYVVMLTEHFSIEVRCSAVAFCMVLTHSVELATLFIFGGRDATVMRSNTMFKWRLLVPLLLGGYAAVTLLAWVLTPEAKGVPLDRVAALWRKHWLWRRWYSRWCQTAALSEAAAGAEVARNGADDGGGRDGG